MALEKEVSQYLSISIFVLANICNPQFSDAVVSKPKVETAQKPVAKLTQSVLKPSEITTFNYKPAQLTSDVNKKYSESSSEEILQMKIRWATEELASSTNTTNVRYSIELCEMIKIASEAILALKRIEL